jgi:sortase A
VANAGRTRNKRNELWQLRVSSFQRPLSQLAAMRQADRPTDSPRRADKRMRQVALAIVLAGVCLLMFVAYAFVFSGLQEARFQRATLEEFVNAHVRTDFLLGLHIQTDQPIAVIDIPAIGLQQIVVKGTSATDLMHGPGLMPNTALPGSKGNCVIAGRHSTAGAPFADITRLRPGTPVTVITGLGKFLYKVTHVGTVSAGGRDPIGPTSTGQLTLVTSNSSFFTSGRDYVTARLITRPAAAPLPRAVPSPAERAMGGDPAATWPTVEWAVLLGLCCAAAVFAYRRWRNNLWVVYLLSTPVLLAVLLIFYSNLFRLLPATL